MVAHKHLVGTPRSRAVDSTERVVEAVLRCALRDWIDDPANKAFLDWDEGNNLDANDTMFRLDEDDMCYLSVRLHACT